MNFKGFKKVGYLGEIGRKKLEGVNNLIILELKKIKVNGTVFTKPDCYWKEKRAGDIILRVQGKKLES